MGNQEGIILEQDDVSIDVKMADIRVLLNFNENHNHYLEFV